MIHIGIDTGVHTGFAVWDSDRCKFMQLDTLPIHAALLVVWDYYIHDRKVHVYFEDARKRKWYGTRTAKQDRAKLQGAGSVKRDSKIWEEALSDWGIPYTSVAPKDNMTKLSSEAFRKLTGYKGRTNEHSRDAAMLVYGR